MHEQYQSREIDFSDKLSSITPKHLKMLYTVKKCKVYMAKSMNLPIFTDVSEQCQTIVLSLLQSKISSASAEYNTAVTILKCDIQWHCSDKLFMSSATLYS